MYKSPLVPSVFQQRYFSLSELASQSTFTFGLCIFCNSWAWTPSLGLVSREGVQVHFQRQCVTQHFTSFEPQPDHNMITWCYDSINNWSQTILSVHWDLLKELYTSCTVCFMHKQWHDIHRAVCTCLCLIFFSVWTCVQMLWYLWNTQTLKQDLFCCMPNLASKSTHE